MHEHPFKGDAAGCNLSPHMTRDDHKYGARISTSVLSCWCCHAACGVCCPNTVCPPTVISTPLLSAWPSRQRCQLMTAAWHKCCWHSQQRLAAGFPPAYRGYGSPYLQSSTVPHTGMLPAIKRGSRTQLGRPDVGCLLADIIILAVPHAMVSKGRRCACTAAATSRTIRFLAGPLDCFVTTAIASAEYRARRTCSESQVANFAFTPDASYHDASGAARRTRRVDSALASAGGRGGCCPM